MGLFEKITWRERHSFCTAVRSTSQDDQMEEDFIGGKRGRGDMHMKFCPEDVKVRDRQEELNAGRGQLKCDAHAQKPDFVFRLNGRVHLNQRGRQFSRLLTAEVCASAVVMLDTLCSEVV